MHLHSMAIVSVGKKDVAPCRAFAHGSVGLRIDPSWGGPIQLFFVPCQYSTTGVQKAVVCAILSE